MMLMNQGEEYSIDHAVESVLDSYSERRYGIIGLFAAILKRMPESAVAEILSEAHKNAVFEHVADAPAPAPGPIGGITNLGPTRVWIGHPGSAGTCLAPGESLPPRD